MNYNTDEWRVIDGFDGVFAVNVEGIVMRLVDAPTAGSKAGRLYKPRLSTNGYLMTRINYAGKTAHCMTHRLIAVAFLSDPPDGKSEVNHKNGIKTDNRIENLEWVTRSENVRHSINVLHQRFARGEEAGRVVLTTEDVLKIREMRDSGMLLKDIGDLFGISYVQAGRIARGEQWKHIDNLRGVIGGNGDNR